MAIETTIRNQIIAKSGLQGTALEELKERLAKMNEEELKVELSRQLSGENDTTEMGIKVEHKEGEDLGSENSYDKHETTDKGEEYFIYDGESLVEKTIVTRDEKNNEIRTTIEYAENQPVKITKSKNGNTESITTIEYHEESTDTVAYATVKTQNVDKTEVETTVLEVSPDGEIQNEDVVDRKTTKPNGTVITIYSENGVLVEQTVDFSGKEIIKGYNGTDITAYDNHKLNGLFEQTEQNGKCTYVEYDGQGNTKTTVQNGESWALIAKRFNVKENELKSLNPKLAKKPVLQVAEDIIIPGEISSDAKEMTKRRSKEESKAAYARYEYNKQAQNIYSSTINETTLTKDYNGNYWELAKDTLKSNGNAKPSNADITAMMEQLQLLNGKSALKKGNKIRLVGSKANATNVNKLTSYGFKPSEKTHGFYEKFNRLTSKEQENVLKTIEYLRKDKITDITQIKTEIFNTLGLNLFDSDKEIHMTSGTSNIYGYQIQTSAQTIPLEIFVKDYLGLDMTNSVGRDVYARLDCLPQEELNKLSAKDYTVSSRYTLETKPSKACAGMTFDQVASELAMHGVTIQTASEIQAIKNNPQEKEREFRVKVAESLAIDFEMAEDMLKRYQDGQGIINVGYWREKVGNLFKNGYVPTSMENLIELVDRDKNQAIARLAMAANAGEEDFEKAFKDITGIEYNKANMEKFFAEAEKINGDFGKAYAKAFGDKQSGWAQKFLKRVSTTDGFCDIAAMLLGTDMISGTTAFKSLASGLAKKTTAKLGAKGAQIVTSSVMGGGNLGFWTLLSGSLNNATAPGIDAKTLDTWKNTGEATLSSMGFGAFGGLLNTTVVDKVVKNVSKALEKPAEKAMSAVEQSLKSGTVMNGTELMATYVQNEAPGFIAQMAGFATEVVGFTGYETALDLCKDFITDGGIDEKSMREKLVELGKSSEDVEELSGVDLVTSYLGNTALGQVKMLGEVKGIAQLMMMHKGGKVAQTLAFEEQMSKYENLKNLKVRKVQINNREVYEVTYANGNKAVASSIKELVGNVQVILKTDMISDFIKNTVSETTGNKVETSQAKAEAKTVAGTTEPTDVKAPEVEENAETNEPLTLSQRLENANSREEFVAIRDEIKKMPQGEEKTTAFEEYTKKYNEWRQSPDRPDVRMEYKPEDEAISQNTESPISIEKKNPITADIPEDLLSSTGAELLTGDKDHRKLKPEKKEEIKKIAEKMQKRAENHEKEIVAFMIEMKLLPEGSDKLPEGVKKPFRCKSIQSLCDKIQNALIDNEATTLEDAINSVNDSFGVRTLEEVTNLADNPAVKEHLDAGDKKAALSTAIEIQSEHILEALKLYIDKVADGSSKVKLIKMSNYVGEDGIPYFTEKQLNELKVYAKSKNVNLPIEVRVDSSEKSTSGTTNKPTTKVRESGYTALQMNFEIEDGFVFEWQYRGKLLNEFAEGEHIPYDLRTNKDIIGDYTELTELYEPMKTLLNTENMSEAQYKEYNNYLTAYYEHLRLKELGFDAGEEPKLPKGFDARLRAQNLELAHEIAEKIKKEPEKESEYLQEYENRLIRNTEDNVTTESYTKKASARTAKDNEPMENIVTDENFEQYKKELENTLRSNGNFEDSVIKAILNYADKNNIKLLFILSSNKDFTEKEIFDILRRTNSENIELAKMMCADKDFLKRKIADILECTTSKNIELAKILCADKDFPKGKIANILYYTTSENIELARMMCTDKDFPKKEIAGILCRTTSENIELARMMCTDKNFPKEEISDILDCTTSENIELAKILCADKDFPKEKIASILCNTTSKKLELARMMCTDKNFPKDEISSILFYTNSINQELAKTLYTDKDFPKGEIASILSKTTSENIELAKILCADKDFPKGEIAGILIATHAYNLELATKLCADKDFPKEKIFSILFFTRHAYQLELATELCSDKNFPKEKIADILGNITSENLELATKLCADKDFPKEKIAHILRYTTSENLELARMMCADKDFPKNEISFILQYTTSENIELATKLCTDKDFPKEEIAHILCYTTSENIENIKVLLNNKDLSLKIVARIVTSSVNTSAWLSNQDLAPALEKLEAQKQKVKENPELYINGEANDDSTINRQIDIYFDERFAKFLRLCTIYDKEAINNLLRMRLETTEEYLDAMDDFTVKELGLLKDLVESTNIDGKPFMPTQKIEFIDLLNAYKGNNLAMTKIEEMVKSGKVDLAQLHMDLFRSIMKNLGLTDEEIASTPLEKLTAWDTKYAHLLAKEIEEERDVAFSDVLRAGNFTTDFNEYLHDSSNVYGQANAETRSRYSEIGMDYDKWVKPSKENEVHFVSKDANTEQMKQVAAQITEDMNTLMQTPIKGFLKKQFPKFIKGDEFVIPTEYTSSKAKLQELVKILSDTSEQGQMSAVWKRAKGNSDNPDPKRSGAAQRTLTILDHLNQRLKDIDNISDTKLEKQRDWTVKMWDRNPQKDIFQGNYSTCCIGMGGGNGSAMPHFVLNTAYNMIEIVDNVSGKTVGNALCYFITGEDGKPAFIVDNIEINNSVKPSSNIGIQLRDAITQYASNVSKEVTGSEEVPIYMSSHYNDVPYEDLPRHRENITFLGDIDCDEIYMDLYDGWVEKSDFSQKQELLKLK